MSVYKRYYTEVINGVVHSFLIDINQAHLAADEANDRDGQSALLRLWLVHFDEFLGNMLGPKLVDYLETRQIWRQHEEWRVFKTVDVPCIAYTAQTNECDVTITALGVCYRYPNGSEDEWWRRVILPRLRALK